MDKIKSGHLYYKNGEKYDGQILKNKENGFGILYKLSINKIYEGEFLKGKKHGKGKLTIDEKTGSFYEGNFKDDLFHGNGLLVTNTNRYEGEFKKGIFSGMGIHIDFKGEAFEGQFENGKKNGMLNKYKMQIDSTCIYENDKLTEIHQKEKNEDISNSYVLSRKNLNKSSEDFKIFCENYKNSINKNEKLMQNLIDVNKLNSILNTDGKNNKFSANKNDANKSEKLKELMNFKDLNKLGGSRMSEISSDFNDDNIDVASLKSYNFQQKNNNNANVNILLF